MKLRRDRKAIRRDEAKARQEVYDKLTPVQKLELLDKRFGKGLGAKKQRARLEKQLEVEK